MNIEQVLFQKNALSSAQCLMGKENISRRFCEITDIFRAYNVNLATAIMEKLNVATYTNPAIIIDLCGGVGEAIEDLTGFTEQVYPQDKQPIDPYIYKKMIGINMDLKPLPELISEELRLENNIRRIKSYDAMLKQNSSNFIFNSNNVLKNNIIIEREAYINNLPKLYSHSRIGDATNIPIKSDRIDIVYSVAGAQYVPDKLKMLEQVYRVLKEDGIGFIQIYSGERGICVSQKFNEIIKNTKGANDVFKIYPLNVNMTEKSNNKLISLTYSNFVVEIKKSKDDIFSGKFPYEFVRKVLLFENNLHKADSLAKGLYVSAEYKHIL